MNFGSDNQSGASDKVIQALLKANQGVSASYGTDEWTLRAEQKLRDVFETDLKAFFVTSGTAANCLALSSMVNPWDTILCHGHAHIINDELTAPEFYTGGARLQSLGLDSPKLKAEALNSYLDTFEGHPPHTAIPRALTLTQLNEAGCAYTLSEINQLTSIARKHDMLVHMDGARFSNALVGLGCSPAEMTWKAGVDVLCLGASKNGTLAAEAVIFFNPDLAANFEFRRKRAGHLLSKGRVLGAQMCAWLEGQHWLDLARTSNERAEQLAEGIRASANAELVWPVDGNELFALIKHSQIEALRSEGAIFYEWPERFLGSSQHVADDESLVRLVISFNTSEREVRDFIRLLG